MGANLKKKNHTKIGNILKSINHDLVSVKVLNYCTNLSALAKEAEKRYVLIACLDTAEMGRENVNNAASVD